MARAPKPVKADKRQAKDKKLEKKQSPVVRMLRRVV
jgi:hypothetical protein